VAAASSGGGGGRVTVELPSVVVFLFLFVVQNFTVEVPHHG
jgi:hypothetical protein